MNKLWNYKSNNYSVQKWGGGAKTQWGIIKLCARFCFKKGGGRQESGKGGKIAFPAVHPFRCHSMSIFQRYIPFVSKDDKPIYLHVNLFFYFNYAVTSNINIVWHPKGWATGKASYPSRHLTPPPPSFTRHCSIPKLHLCASHKINRQNCFKGNIFKLQMGLIDWVYIKWDIQLPNKSYDAICVF